MHHVPKVFISIVNWNKCNDTIECLESVFKMGYRNYTVIVVDNASNDSAPAIIRSKFPHVIVMENKENLGFTGGHNITMRYAKDHGADYIWLLNNDTIIEVDTLSALIEVAEKDASVGLVSPQINYYDYPSKAQFRGSYFDWRKFQEVYPSADSHAVDPKFQCGDDVILWGTALLIKRAVIEKIGYLDEWLFAYCEDLDYSIRAIKAEFRNVLHAGARVLHKNDLHWHENRLPYYYYYMTRNWCLLRSGYLRGWLRIDMHRIYLVKVLDRISFFIKYRNDQACLDAVIAGAWHGIIRIGGRMPASPKTPYVIEKMLLLLGSHPPYLWSFVIDGQWGLVVKKGVLKCKTLLSSSK